jgi:hypothetical protein
MVSEHEKMEVVAVEVPARVALDLKSAEHFPN